MLWKFRNERARDDLEWPRKIQQVGWEGDRRGPFKDIEPYTEPGTTVKREGKMCILTIAPNTASSVDYTRLPLTNFHLDKLIVYTMGLRNNTLNATSFTKDTKQADVIFVGRLAKAYLLLKTLTLVWDRHKRICLTLCRVDL